MFPARRLTLPLLLATALAACSVSEPIGGTCTTNTVCASGLCTAGTCREPSDDDDGDGLSNATEARLGTSLDRADSDGDGLVDPLEVGTADAPLDSDGDGRIDALESRAADDDGDCLPDDLDPAEAQGPAPSEALAARFCPALGVCGVATRSASCTDGRPACVIDSPDVEPTESRCDGLDNDCDGLTDEHARWQNIAVGGACTRPGECGTGVVACVAGEAACVTDAGAARAGAAEVCNGLDDDCDGLIDEDVSTDAAVGAPCPGLGLCRDGVFECRGGGLVCSSAAGGSSWDGTTEVCNGLDDDCDGVVDNGFSLADQPLGGACGRGVCAGGEVVCTGDGTKAECSTDGLPTAETCNDQDDDCDGETDEVVDLDPADAGCPSVGVCAAPLVVSAQCQGAWECTAPPGSPWQLGTEISCDGMDNDCDGTTDEAFGLATPAETTPMGSSCGLGVCTGGTVICGEGGTAAVCSTAALATAESCNDQDDDCDGVTDEDLIYAGQPVGGACTGRGLCGAGVVECSVAGSPVCSSNPDGSASGAKPENCNGLDDDCDGKIDDLADVIAATVTCPAAGICDAVAPVVGCVGGELVCDFSVVPGFQVSESTCDSLDNDCDSFTDEGLPKRPIRAVRVSAGLPTARIRAAVASRDDRVYVVGGESPAAITGSEPDVSHEVWSYSVTAGWDRLDDLPTGRRGAAAVPSPSSDAHVVVVGGEDDSGLPIGTLDRLTDEGWITDDPGGAAAQRMDHAAVVSGSGPDAVIWVIGGTSLGAPNPVSALGLANGSWLPSIPSGPGWLAGTAAALLPDSGTMSGGRIVVQGGRDGQAPLGGRTWILDIDAGGWTPLDLPGPGARAGHTMATLPDGRVALAGGVDAQGHTLTDVWVLDASAQGWQPGLLSLPSASAGVFTATDSHVLWFGLGSQSDPATVSSLDADGITAGSTSWQPHEGGPEPRLAPALAVRPNGQLWLFGGRRPTGSGDEALSDMWLRDADGPWTRDDRPGAPTRLGFAATYSVSGERLWIHGGRTSIGATSASLYSYDSAGWHNGPTTLPATSEHAITVDEAGKRLLIAAVNGSGSSGSTMGVWSAPLSSGSSTLLVTKGDVPPKLTRPAFAVTADGTAAVLAGGLGSDGQVWTLSLVDLTWTKTATLGGLDAASPLAVFEPGSQRLLVWDSTSGVTATPVGALGADAATEIELQATTSPLPLSSAGTAFDALRAAAWVLGGVNATGQPTSALWRIDFGCMSP